MRVTVSASCLMEERLQNHSLMEQRSTNDTFTVDSAAVVFGIRRKFIKHL